MSEPKSNRRARHAVREHLPRWMLDLATDAGEILAASPYITEERLFRKCDPRVARLYTAFNALSFISGASSLRVLKVLLSKGVAIYHVEFLHAKVVMINGENFSMGSQNLTVRGRRKNVEASFVGGCETPSKEVREFFDRIHKNARAISTQDIAEMENLIEPWIKKFEEIEQAADGIDQELDAKREEREEVKRRMRAALERRKREELEIAKRESEEHTKKEAEKRDVAERSERMKRAVSQLAGFFDQSKAPPSSKLLASVEEITNSGTWRTTSTDSLLPVDRGRDFEGLLTAIGVKPEKFSRYLIVNAVDGRLGFVRFAKTRWTFFESALRPYEPLKVNGFVWRVEIDFDWTPAGNIMRNGVAHLRSPYYGGPRIVSAGFAFSVTGIELIDFVVATQNELGRWGYLVKDCEINVKTTEAALNAYLSIHLTKQFKFENNLSGKQAFNFFGHRHPVTYQIQAHRFGETAVFSARRDPPERGRVLSFRQMGIT